MIEPSHELKPVWQRLAHYGVLTFAGLILAGLTIASGPARANDLYRTEYDISIFGLSIARSAIETTVNGANYNLNGRFLTSGLARVFDDTDGTVHVTGSAVGARSCRRASISPISMAARTRARRSASPMAMSSRRKTSLR